MASVLKRPILVVAGIGTGSGTGASTARLFAKQGYRVALIARNADHLAKAASEINAAGGEAAPFPVASYDQPSIQSAFSAIKSHWPSNESAFRVAVWNVGVAVFKPFLDISTTEIQSTFDVGVIAAFAFAREAITTFKEQDIDETGKRGALIFTGATASLKGNVMTSAFSSGKWALRALSQSLNKEFGKDNIHVSHAIMDGAILTNMTREWKKSDPNFETNEDIRLHPDSLAKAYMYLANQDRSAWTWELDLRPAHEKW